MSRIEIHNRVSDFNSYRAARVKSLFNAENGCNFDLEIDADLDFDWSIGVVVGPSGSGKTSIGRTIFGEDKIYDYHDGWAVWREQDERFATFEPSWDRPRLKRNELIQIGG